LLFSGNWRFKIPIHLLCSCYFFYYLTINFVLQFILVDGRSSYNIVPTKSKVTATYGEEVQLEWVLPPVTGYIIISTTVYLNEAISRKSIIIEGVSHPNVNAYGEFIFGKRISADVTDNVYTITITNAQYNDTHKFILKAAFQKIAQSSGAFLESTITIVQVQNPHQNNSVKGTNGKDPQNESELLTIGLASGISILLLSLIIVVVLYCKRKRVKKSSNGKSRNGADGSTSIQLNDVNGNTEDKTEEDKFLENETETKA